VNGLLSNRKNFNACLASALRSYCPKHQCVFTSPLITAGTVTWLRIWISSGSDSRPLKKPRSTALSRQEAVASAACKKE